MHAFILHRQILKLFFLLSTETQIYTFFIISRYSFHSDLLILSSGLVGLRVCIFISFSCQSQINFEKKRYHQDRILVSPPQGIEPVTF